jgi:hypothetical protein
MLPLFLRILFALGVTDPGQAPIPLEWWVDSCDREVTVDASDRKDARERARRACQSTGASASTCEMLDVVVVRESSGRAAVAHTLGPNEDGLGLAGLSVTFHREKWRPDAPREVLCVPEVSAAVVLRIWRNAVEIYKARTRLDLQRVFAGRWYDVGKPPMRDRDASWCRRLLRRGLTCFDPVKRKDLGRGPAPAEQDRWLAELVEEADAT